MEPLFRTFVVGLVPQLVKMPPEPFEREALQRAFFDISRFRRYQHLGFLADGGSAQFTNSPDDRILVQPDLIQVALPVESTMQRAREDALGVVGPVVDRLQLRDFVQVGINVTAHVPLPPPLQSAREFVDQRFVARGEHVDELGSGFFVGGLKYRSADATAQPAREDVLLVEPLLADDKFIWLNYDVGRFGAFAGTDSLGEWIDDAFSFIADHAMRILEA
jgi:hypothetical protein